MAYFIPVPTAFATVPQFDSVYGTAAGITGFEIALAGATTFTVNAGGAAAENNGDGIVYPSLQSGLPGIITVDISLLAEAGSISGNLVSPGVSGVFPVSIASLGLASDTTFPVYILGDDSGKNVPIAVVATGNNFLVPGYSSFRRIGWIFVDSATSNLVRFVQSGSFSDREYMFTNPIPVLSGGSATTATLIDLSLGDGPIVPGPTSKVKLAVSFTPNAQADLAILTTTGFTGNMLAFQAAAAATCSWPNTDIIPGVDPVTGHAGITYYVSIGADVLDVSVIGFTDSLRLSVV